VAVEAQLQHGRLLRIERVDDQPNRSRIKANLGLLDTILADADRAHQIVVVDAGSRAPVTPKARCAPPTRSSGPSTPPPPPCAAHTCWPAT
jgi:hypothetical protein